MLFLDPSKPIATCVSETCNGCPVGETLHCHFSLRDLIHFLLIALPSFLVGGVGIYHRNGWMLILWLIMVVGYFGFIEIRVMCSHCPHYAEPGSSLKCWANYGSPKIWKYRPGPMTLIEKIVFWRLCSCLGVPAVFFDSRSSMVSAYCLCTHCRCIFHDLKNIPLFTVYKFLLSYEYG